MVACCPHCGYNGSDAPFYEIDILFGYARFYPVVESDGSITHQWTGETDVDWDSQRVAKELLPAEKLYQCPECDGEFDQFAIAESEEDELEEDED